MSPEQVIDLYRDGGYSFLAITDHWKYGIYQYLQTEDIIIFGSVELDKSLPPELGFCHHVVFMAVPEDTPFKHGQDLSMLCNDMSMQEMIAFMTANGHIAIYAHPRWSGVKMEEFDSIQGCTCLEVYNYNCEIGNGRGESSFYYEHSLWNGKNIFCNACDDTHTESDCFGGYIVVKAKSLTHRDIIDAIKTGSFYASTGGPDIFDFCIEDRIAHISCSAAKSIAFFSDGWFGDNHHADEALLVQASWDTEEALRPVSYVYAVCSDEKGNHSWTQPIRLQRK